MESLDQLEFDTLISVIRETRGIDFSDYAMSSLRRRFSRFMTMNNLGGLDELSWKLRYDNAFADFFVREVTVNVTEMFRDPSFWSTLRDDILPELINYPVIRIWHAACSTGEEVYSMAILLNELGVLHKARIMATDVNSSVLDIARKGRFPTRNQELNRKNYASFGGKNELRDYYKWSEAEVTYDPQLISNVEFRIHDLSRERSFSKFDLILCRNVMIYFNFRLQERVLDIFRESLDGGAYLGIGSKESIEWCKSSRYFQTVNHEEKIYRRI